MKTRKAILWITAILPLLPVILTYGKLPSTVAIHWGIDGAVNGTAPKPMLFLLGCIGIFITAIMLLSERFDKNAAKPDQKDIYNDVSIIVNLMIFGVMCSTIIEALKPNTLDIGRIATLIVGIVFAFMGNKMPKTRQNRVFGFRTALTLNNTEAWNYVSRISGWAMFICGIAVMVSAFVLPAMPRAVFLLIAVAVAITVSYLAGWKYTKK